jgi:formylglycine-generating enzyme required for sulfatase activity
LNRIFIVRDAGGERRLGEQALPLNLGGADAADIIMPGVPAERLLAHVAVADGHAYIQPAEASPDVLHNKELLSGSRWLKSGDEIRVDDAVMNWTVQGDLVIIETRTEPIATASALAGKPPAMSPPQQPVPETVWTGAQRKPYRKLRWTVFVVFVLLLLMSMFVLLATPIMLQISPQPSEYSLDGFPPPVKVGERWLAIPGDYLVSASLDGYYPLHEAVQVFRGELQKFTLQLRELPGSIGFSLQPPVDFRVFIDGSAVLPDVDGMTEVIAGTHQLRIETDRYLPVTEQVQISGRGEAQHFSYELRPGWADVQINSDPVGATIRIDSQVRGLTPLTAELMAGTRHIELTLEKYTSVAVQHEIIAGTQAQLDTIVLTPANGELAISSEPSGATISVAGVFHGRTPAKVSLSSTEQHTVRLSKPGYQPADRQIRLEPEELRELAVKLQAEYGIVFVSTRPADANLSIDGKPAGDATRRLRLTTRSHLLSFSKPGYVGQQVSVTPRSGVSRNINITLKTRAQDKAERVKAQTPHTRTTAAGQRLRLVRPVGEIRMGSSRREAGRRANESSRKVRLSRPFYLSEKEVTNAEYRRFRFAHDSGQAEGAPLNDDALPVVNLSWNDAARYCNWLSRQDGLTPVYQEKNGDMQALSPLTNGYRLPTEVEWAYVARKLGRQATARYPWSGQYPPTGTIANFADSSIADALANTVPGYNDGYRAAAPVGSFPAQSGGFYDLGGNVAEWMHDYYAVYPGMAGTLVTDPAGPAHGDHHVVRGSSWRQGSIAELRLSYRDYSRDPRPDLGFRIARYAE